MGVIKLTIGAVNATDYVIVTARKVTNPDVIVAEEVFTAAQVNENVNAILPASGDIPPGTYYVNYFLSSDGVIKEQPLKEFVLEAKIYRPIAETLYYTAGGISEFDPIIDDNKIIDPYLDGKNITAVYIENFRPLKTPYDSEGELRVDREFEMATGGTLQLLGDRIISEGECVVVEITHILSVEVGGSGSGLYSTTVLINSNTILTANHRGKRIKCESIGITLEIILENVLNVSEGDFYHFTCNSGLQKKVKIIGTILYEGQTETELSIGLGEYVRIERSGNTWEATLSAPGLFMVGEVFSKGLNDSSYKNALPEDARLVDGDIEPRLFYWVKNKLTSTHKIIDPLVININYVHPVGKEGMFVVHPTLKKFRLPNSQGYVRKGLKSYTTFNTDVNRDFDYPGGTELGRVGSHEHDIKIEKESTSKTDNGSGRIVGGGDGNEPVDMAITLHTEIPSDLITNAVDNIGDIFLRRT